CDTRTSLARERALAPPVQRVLIALALPLGAALAMWGTPIAASATAFTVHPWAFACGHTSFGNPATKADTPGTGGCPSQTPPSFCAAGDVAGDATASFDLGTLTLSKNGPTCDLLAAGASIREVT